MAFCPDLVAAGPATGGHKSVIDNNSLPSIHFSSPCACPPFIHITLCGCSVKDKKRLFFSPHNFILYCLQYKRVRLPQGLCVFICEVFMCFNLHPQIPEGLLRYQTFEYKTKVPTGSLHLPSLPKLISNQEE